MNEKFFALDEEKQLRIINSGLKEFSINEYKRASTDEIAAGAGISKGLLFYYFHNKKEYYLFLYDYAVTAVTDSVVGEEFASITDFFELFDYSAQKKFELFEKTPYISDFLIKAFFSQREDISAAMNEKLENSSVSMLSEYFNNVDMSKFKEDVNPVEILEMLTWMVDGYMHEKRRSNDNIDLAVLMEKYKTWSSMLKQISYKEEFLK